MKRFLYALAAATLLLCSCEKEISFIGQYEGRKLVLYACANPDTTLSVELHTSKFILDSTNLSIFGPINGATVTGRVGGREITFRQEESSRGAYLSDYIPSVSDKIELFASSDGFDDVHSTAVVPKPADFSIDSYSVKVVDEANANWIRYRISVKVTLRDDPSERNFYRISFLRKWYGNWEVDTPLTNDVIFRDNAADIEGLADYIEGDTEIYLDGLIDDSMMDGKACQFEIWMEDWIVPEDERLYASDRESMAASTAEFDPTRYAVEIDTASEDTYKYCQSVASFNMYDDFLGFFGEPVSIHNNIVGGIGCFSALTPHIIPLKEE